jgi:hypothetical protein
LPSISASNTLILKITIPNLLKMSLENTSSSFDGSVSSDHSQSLAEYQQSLYEGFAIEEFELVELNPLLHNSSSEHPDITLTPPSPSIISISIDNDDEEHTKPNPDTDNFPDDLSSSSDSYSWEATSTTTDSGSDFTPNIPHIRYLHPNDAWRLESRAQYALRRDRMRAIPDFRASGTTHRGFPRLQIPTRDVGDAIEELAALSQAIRERLSGQPTACLGVPKEHEFPIARGAPAELFSIGEAEEDEWSEECDCDGESAGSLVEVDASVIDELASLTRAMGLHPAFESADVGMVA